MSNLDAVKTAIDQLWNEEFREIQQLRERRQQEASSLKAAWSVANQAYEQAEALRADREPLIAEHSRALLEDDQDRAADLKRRYKDLEKRADSLEEQAIEALSALREGGVEGQDRKVVQRELEARVAGLQGTSAEEMALLEQVQQEAAELLNSLTERARPFVNALPAGAERTQAAGYILQKTG